MKLPMLATIITLGMSCVAGVSAAQDETQTTNLQNITVTGIRAPYETYVVNLHQTYGLHVLVGNTRTQYMQAQRAAGVLEGLRKQGAAVNPYVSAVIDNSSGPGVARQIQVSDGTKNMVAIVNVYCKRVVPSGGAHCKLISQPVSGSPNGQRLASTQVAVTARMGG